MRDFEKRNEERKARWEEKRAKWEAKRNEFHHGNGHIWTGALLLIIGGVALAKSLGVIMPEWLFTWQMLLIVIGLFIGLKKGFRGGWFVPVIIGGAFLANEFVWHGQMYRHLWPIILIVIGLAFLTKSKKKHWANCYDEKKNTAMNNETTPTTATAITTPPPGKAVEGEDDYLNITSIFGGTEKTVLSKNFRGGSMVNIFGGSEVNLTQADINGTAVLDVTAIFGGATLIVPSNWVVKSDAALVFGGISDKRTVSGFSETTSKNLVLKGTILFGGLEIKSF
jgi:predicted membrane protein